MKVGFSRFIRDILSRFPQQSGALQSINAVLFRTGPILGIILIVYALGSRLIDAGMDRLENRLGAWRFR